MLGNALRYAPQGTPIVVHCRIENEWIRIVTEGPGVPEAELGAIFDKFVQASHTRTGAGGTGLGLAIARGVISAHGGRIWAENRDEGGLRVVVELPVLA